MRLVANYTVFYGEAFIEWSLRSVYPFVDYIQIAIGDRSWKNMHNETFPPIDNLKERVRHFMLNEDPEHKIILYTGQWSTDTDQRNFLLERSRGLADYIMIIDSDEVWEEAQIKQLRGVLEDNHKRKDYERFFGVGIRHYYRSLYWRHDPKTAVCYIYKVEDDITHKWIRHPGFRGEPNIVPLDLYYHHYGYAYPSDIIKKKVSFWGHNDEVPTSWFEDTFMKWTPNGGVPAFSPTNNDWSKLEHCEVIKEMQDHPFTKFEIIP